MERYIRFDWAAKRMLRDKANYDVLEGLVSVLLGETITIVELLESEGNQETETDKFNRVDIKAKNSKGEYILVEIQQTRELYYLQRILYGVAKTITEHIQLGDKYDQVKKVYSISIVYFDLGRGNDWLYHGENQFIGVHTHDQLEISTRDKNIIRMVSPKDVFPEYYIIRVNEFNQVATTPLEEWLDYLKSGHIKDDTTTPGLTQAREKLRYLQMTPAERHAYDRHIDNIMVENDILETKILEGLEQGLEQGIEEGFERGMKQGLEQGLEQGMQQGLQQGLQQGMQQGMQQGLEQGLQQGQLNEKYDTARRLKALGLSAEQIAQGTGLTIEQIASIE